MNYYLIVPGLGNSGPEHWQTYFANQWGSKLISIVNAGHINTDSGFGKWKQGLEILNSLD